MQLDEMLRQVFQVNCEKHKVEYKFIPCIDIYSTEEAFVIEMDLPGVSEKNFSVSVNGRKILIEGVKYHDQGIQHMHYICIERCFGHFKKSVIIPDEFSPGEAVASFSKGVLVIKIPKLKHSEPRIKNVPIIQGD
jgi:HSP20 family protein